MTEPVLAPSYVRAPLAAFLNSLAVDRPLARFDLAGSIAHVEMLGRAGLLSPDEAATLVGGLRRIGEEMATGAFLWREELEDVHTNIEVRLTELVGPTGGKLHTARSRNDQVALDERLYLRWALSEVAHRLVRLEEGLLARAAEGAEVAMPGYTHLQRAQPVSVAHTLLAHFWRFERDLDRLLATAARANVSPLGAGALAGSTLPIDPTYVAGRLGFERAFENSLDAVSDRDPFAELLFDLALLGVHASALGEEIVLFATKEFGYLDRTPVLGSGSSLMPQKRNPDAAELVRGKAGRAIGDLVALLTTLKGLPLAYDRDLQEDKAPVLDAVARASAVLEALTEIVSGLQFNRARLLEASSDPDLLATDLVEYLVAHGTAFREAHETVGRFLRGSSGRLEPRAVETELAGAGPDVVAVLDPRSALDHRVSPGGPGSPQVARQFALARTRLASQASSLSSLDQKVGLVEELLTEERR